MKFDYQTILLLLNGFGALAEGIRTASSIESGLSESELRDLRQRTEEIRSGLMDAYDEAEAKMQNEG